ncbi:hypothetical protein GCM10010442_33680 [Kitasatospora kifunensis]
MTFPTTTLTGDGSTTDFGSWFGNSSCASVTESAVPGTVTYTYGNIPTGTSQCTFTVTPPAWTTLNNTVATLTPTINGTNFSSSAGPSAALTVTAVHSSALRKASSVGSVLQGGKFNFAVYFYCGTAAGALGASSFSISDTLPTNLTVTSDEVISPGSTGTLSLSGGVLTYTDSTGADCTNAGYVEIEIDGTATTAGVPDAPGSTISNTATATETYLDGTPASFTSSTSNVQVVQRVVPNPFLAKTASTDSYSNQGYYKFNGVQYQTTYPGNWDGTNDTSTYAIQLTTGYAAAGFVYGVQDPLPCLSNLSSGVYSSNAPGTVCADPAWIPTRVVAGRFTPTSADSITLLLSNGTTQTVAYSNGGWTIPAGLSVSEIDFPPFPEEANNAANPIGFALQGYAASTVTTPGLLTNTVTVNIYDQSNTTTPLAPLETNPASILVESANNSIIYPAVSATNEGGCVEQAAVQTGLEMPTAPNSAIYIDYLAPVGASVTSSLTQVFSVVQVQGAGGFAVPGGNSYSATVTGTSTPNYNGTGRTLYQWIFPAGTILKPGDYNIAAAVNVNLGAGCDGTFNNDLTAGYGTQLTACQTPGGAVPTNPSADSDLQSNGSPVANNYCGASAPLTVAAIDPAFSVDKTVQGNLDASPVSAGGIGDVSPTGGTATYNVTFTNTGQSNLTNPVMYDLLPAVGDTDATSTTARGSQFPVTLTGVGPVPAGVTVSYSTATNPCRPEVLATNPGCVSNWTTTLPSPLSSVTALKFVYTGTVYVSGGAGINSFSIPITVSTPISTPGNVAWNTVGTTADAGTGGAALAPAESSRTGLKADNAAPTVTKTVVSPTTPVTAAGQTVTYSFTVTNTTAVTLTGVTVNDTQSAPAGPLASGPTCQQLTGPAATCSGSSATLAPGQSATFTATYTTTAADIDHGGINDSATATGTPPTGGAITGPASSATVPVATLHIAKTVTPPGPANSGQVLTYTITVTNPGTATYTGATITDNMAGTLDQGTLTGTPTASTGTATITGTNLTWTGDVPAGATATITYQVTVN